jgi:hypothetical protein
VLSFPTSHHVIYYTWQKPLQAARRDINETFVSDRPNIPQARRDREDLQTGGQCDHRANLAWRNQDADEEVQVTGTVMFASSKYIAKLRFRFPDVRISTQKDS